MRCQAIEDVSSVNSSILKMLYKYSNDSDLCLTMFICKNFTDEVSIIPSQESDVTSHFGKQHWHRKDEVLMVALDVLAEVEDHFSKILQTYLMRALQISKTSF